jgi:CSLREA domain-containing protein
MRRSLLLVAMLFALPLFASTYTVNTALDLPDATPGDDVCNNGDGACSLRGAIQEANAHAGADTIAFNAAFLIMPGTPLPAITERLTIDGTTAPGYAGVPLVIIDGNGIAGVGLDVLAGADQSLITGVQVSSFNTGGIRIASNSSGVTASYVGPVLSGVAAGDGIIITGGTNNFVGAATGAMNVISGNQNNGIFISGGSGHTIIRNRIGTNVAGTAALANGGDGVNVLAGDTITIGSATAGAGNLISGNAGGGVAVGQAATSVTIIGNNIGLDVTGVNIIGNGEGVFLATNGTVTIGGTAAGQGNVISGNIGSGIDVTSAGTVGVFGNIIGLRADGTDVRGNGFAGVEYFNAHDITIGSLTGSGRNVISGNSDAGILFEGTATTGITIVNNYIGTDPTGVLSGFGNLGIGISMLAGTTPSITGNLISGNGDHGIFLSGTTSALITSNIIGRDKNNAAALPNINDGIRLSGLALNNTIGGATSLQNVIASNGQVGIHLFGESVDNAVFPQNSIFLNTGLGIDLSPDGVTPNDPMDPDAGVNSLQNFPTVTSAVTTGSASKISGTINTNPNTSVSIHLYSNPAADPNEGRTYLGSTNVVTDVNGDASFTFNGAALTVGDAVTSTANGPHGTSEFSAPATIAAAPSVQFSAATYSVSEAGPTVTITVTRTGDTSGTTTVNYATSNGTATAPADYNAASGTVTFLPTETSKTFLVTINDDNVFEGNETVNLTLSNPNVGTLGAQSTAVLTITENDSQPTISISDRSLSEGNGGTTAFGFTVTLSNPTTSTVMVTYTTTNGTALSGSDYTTASGTITFNPLVTTQPINVNVLGDTTFEPNETFTVDLSGASNATISDPQGLGTIQNDDSQPTIIIDDRSLNEGNALTTAFTFTVTLSNASSSSITVDYATAPGTATAVSDYAVASGTITFNPGVTSQPITVNVVGDTSAEPDETFFVNLTGASGASITDSQGLGTILNDDSGAADLSITKSVALSLPQHTATFTIVVTNNGPGTATGISMSDTVPAFLTLSSATVPGGSCTGNPTIVCTLPSLASGASVAFTIVLTEVKTYPIYNVATVSATTPDPNMANNSTFSTEIPAMSMWVLIALALGLAMIGWMKVR